ncbi:ROK family protein [Cellvibrio japonicus]|uniref:Putative glucokinase n=1 Tax=Cellvibrio japonicus (strain Ueda107) TaxID=498211 RepID=B3PEF1_CELJU|nr:ROK family protein [Cellvibrio japonicus]ACE82709.1 putative glucokinase [Cellvibrio japonicus Ueda107]QEI13525.1 ROK family protein [Cellvibrio japonicus]QEI17099.1 ROK family protein [Cellvibrio japonicus]QEI20676.1 ROK family protein [Cellvibrio japonicus]
MDSIVVDIGGTNLRCGIFAKGQLQQVSRTKVNNFINASSAEPRALYQSFMDQLASALSPYLRDYPDYPLALSFPGPISPQGVVYSAPTLWGNHLQNIPFLEDCSALLGRRVLLMNDISAAVWRYVESQQDAFCIFTISSGVGNKIFRQGNVLLGELGQGGELGHHRVEYGDRALPCDCGGKGHLGAMASGRGLVQLAKHLAGEQGSSFARSYLGNLVQHNPAAITSEYLVIALKQDDPFCREVLVSSQQYLVQVMSSLYHAMGLQRFIFIGGFVAALGDIYLSSLRQLLVQESWFGLTVEDMSRVCELGALDDDHSLIGLGRYMEAHHG